MLYIIIIYINDSSNFLIILRDDIEIIKKYENLII